jgi:hypothetical protein
VFIHRRVAFPLMSTLMMCMGVVAARGAAAPDIAPAGASDRYFRMKQVKIIDEGNHAPAVDLMIPTTWQFQGAVHWEGGLGGCLADLAAVSFHAQSADGSVVLESVPDFTFQYADDPAMQREMQKGIKIAGKPCPVMRPMHAADFLRQAVIPRLRNGKRIVSIEPFPELNQLVRQRLGLPPDAAGAGNQGAIRTDAARARLEYDLNGQAVEEWLTTVMIVRIIPAGRGNAYDGHDVMVMSLRAPKGKLDGNDKLFRLIASTIHPEAQWNQAVHSMITQLYQTQQQERAKQSAMMIAFQQHVAQTVNETTANSARGANQAAAGESQIIRSVQTFRNPATGATFELSNLYDHAWMNGSNEYVMSDDLSFDPNRDLNGSWTSMQLVHAQP